MFKTNDQKTTIIFEDQDRKIFQHIRMLTISSLYHMHEHENQHIILNCLNICNKLYYKVDIYTKNAELC